MARTFTNEPCGARRRHECRTEKGHYLMGPSWIDTASPRDMMDYDFTASWSELLRASSETHQLWVRGQVQP